MTAINWAEVAVGIGVAAAVAGAPLAVTVAAGATVSPPAGDGVTPPCVIDAEPDVPPGAVATVGELPHAAVAALTAMHQ
jgi:hypothetical protein